MTYKRQFNIYLLLFPLKVLPSFWRAGIFKKSFRSYREVFDISNIYNNFCVFFGFGLWILFAFILCMLFDISFLRNLRNKMQNFDQLMKFQYSLVLMVPINIKSSAEKVVAKIKLNLIYLRDRRAKKKLKTICKT